MIFSKAKIADFLVFIFFAFSAVILTTSKAYSTAVLEGVKLWVACIIPALFPYLFITSILSTLKTTNKLSSFLSPLFRKTFKVEGQVGYAFILSLISGYPVGAKVISDLKNSNQISDFSATKGAILCSPPSPVFLISSVGSLMFNSALFGLLVFICNTLSTILVGLIFTLKNRKIAPNDTPKRYQAKISNPIYDGVFGAVNSILFVGGLIILFYVFSEILKSVGLLVPTTKLFGFIFGDNIKGEAISFSILESTKGLKLLATRTKDIFTLPIVCSITGFGGLSVILQSVAFLKNAKIKTAPFVLSKTISAVINFILGFIVSLLFQGRFF